MAIELERWLKKNSPKLIDANETIILGVGNGEHLHALSELHAGLNFTVVDPRNKCITDFTPNPTVNFRYVNSIEGVHKLQKRVQMNQKPIPILCYRPVWYPEKVFFDWVFYTLMEPLAPSEWQDQPAAFILESLFR